MKKITELTPEQTELLDVFRDEWMAHGLSTAPLDEKEVTAAVHELYKCGDLDPPENIVICDSPLAMVRRAAFEITGETSGRKFSEAAKECTRNAIFGQHDAHWVGFYSYFDQVLNIPGTEKIRGLAAVGRACGWLLPYEYACFVSKRPTICKLNSDGVLHNEHGPAIEYADGLRVYAYKGTVLPDAWMEGAMPDAANLLRWENMEQRTAGCELLGWANVLNDASLKIRVIDEDPNPLVGKLVEVSLPDTGRTRFLLVRCPTGRDFALCVPNEYNTALEAKAGTFDVDPDVIKSLAIET